LGVEGDNTFEEAERTKGKDSTDTSARWDGKIRKQERKKKRRDRHLLRAADRLGGFPKKKTPEKTGAQKKTPKKLADSGREELH